MRKQAKFSFELAVEVSMSRNWGLVRPPSSPSLALQGARAWIPVSHSHATKRLAAEQAGMSCASCCKAPTSNLPSLVKRAR
jgi:hypothetical protein